MYRKRVSTQEAISNSAVMLTHYKKFVVIYAMALVVAALLFVVLTYHYHLYMVLFAFISSVLAMYDVTHLSIKILTSSSKTQKDFYKFVSLLVFAFMIFICSWVNMTVLVLKTMACLGVYFILALPNELNNVISIFLRTHSMQSLVIIVSVLLGACVFVELCYLGYLRNTKEILVYPIDRY